MAIIKQTLKEALDAVKIAALPQEGDKDSDWQTAIALVSRSVGGVQSYAVVEKTDDKISVKKDFGMAYQCSGIRGIVQVFPLSKEAVWHKKMIEDVEKELAEEQARMSHASEAGEKEEEETAGQESATENEPQEESGNAETEEPIMPAKEEKKSVATTTKKEKQKVNVGRPKKKISRPRKTTRK